MIKTLDSSKQMVIIDEETPAKEPKLIDDVLRQIMGHLPRGYGKLICKYQLHEKTLIHFTVMYK